MVSGRFDRDADFGQREYNRERNDRGVLHPDERCDLSDQGAGAQVELPFAPSHLFLLEHYGRRYRAGRCNWSYRSDRPNGNYRIYGRDRSHGSDWRDRHSWRDGCDRSDRSDRS